MNDPTRRFAQQQRKGAIGQSIGKLLVFLLLYVPFVLWNGFVLQLLSFEKFQTLELRRWF